MGGVACTQLVVVVVVVVPFRHPTPAALARLEPEVVVARFAELADPFVHLVAGLFPDLEVLHPHAAGRVHGNLEKREEGVIEWVVRWPGGMLKRRCRAIHASPVHPNEQSTYCNPTQALPHRKGHADRRPAPLLLLARGGDELHAGAQALLRVPGKLFELPDQRPALGVILGLACVWVWGEGWEVGT